MFTLLSLSPVDILFLQSEPLTPMLALVNLSPWAQLPDASLPFSHCPCLVEQPILQLSSQEVWEVRFEILGVYECLALSVDNSVSVGEV